MTNPSNSLIDAMDVLRKSKSHIIPGSVSSRIAAELRAQIDDGVLPPGLRLGEELLSEAFGVSRNTVREAFVELAGERLVERLPNRGVFVTTPSIDDIVDVYRMRRVVEVGALRTGGTPETIANVRAAVERGKLAMVDGNRAELISANQRFHEAVVAMAQSDRLNGQMSILLAEMRLFFFSGEHLEAFHERYMKENEGICQLIEAGDLDAASVQLTDYLMRAEAEMVAAQNERTS
ncbi:GntR family transcriptional regulator [soil metagenome]